MFMWNGNVSSGKTLTHCAGGVTATVEGGMPSLQAIIGECTFHGKVKE